MRFVKWAVPAVAPVLVFVALPARSAASDYAPARVHLSVGDWRLDIFSDRFSGEHRCRLTANRRALSYERGSVIVHLGGGYDATDTAVRVDSGSPVRWRDLIPQLARRDPGFVVDRQHLPLLSTLVKGARRLAVSPGFGRRPRIFRIGGFDEAMQQAAALGCRSDAAFVR